MTRAMPINKFNNKCCFSVNHFLSLEMVTMSINEKNGHVVTSFYIRIIRATLINGFYNFKYLICQNFYQNQFLLQYKQKLVYKFIFIIIICAFGGASVWLNLFVLYDITKSNINNIVVHPVWTTVNIRNINKIFKDIIICQHLN